MPSGYLFILEPFIFCVNVSLCVKTEGYVKYFTKWYFAKYISNNISIPVCMWDERLSTEGAFNLTSNLDINVSKKVEKLDQNAASFILQGAIDYIRR